MKVGYFLRPDNACDYYRAKLPIETADFHGVIQSEKIYVNNVLMDIHYNPERFKSYMQSDIYLIPRIIERGLVRRIQSHISENSANSKVGSDFDDNIFRINPMSPHYADYGTEEVKLKYEDGKIIDLWKDKKNIDITRNRALMEEAKLAAGKMDFITVTNENLKKVFSQYNENVYVFPNYIDMKLYNRLPMRNDKIKIFWGGGYSHYQDMALIADVLKDIAAKYKNVKISILGEKFETMFDGIPEDQFEFYQWVDHHNYSYLLHIINPDIAVIPLVDNEFNRCKSPLKWVEMAALKVPSVTSHVEPYTEVAGYDENNGCYIENNDPHLWYKAICDMVENEKKRIDMGELARKTAEEYFDINKNYRKLVDIYKSVIGKTTKTSLEKIYI